MTIELWWIGKTSFPYLSEGIDIYLKRIKRYCKFNLVEFSDIKFGGKKSIPELKTQEGALIMKKVNPKDFLILLDENGSEFDSVKFSKQIEQLQNSNPNKIIFLIGGAYGFSEQDYKRANKKISLSKMTFSHQMIRLLFLEQLYRAHTIIKREPYHHI